MSSKSIFHAMLAAGVTLLFWAGAFPAITVALESFEPLPLAALRFATASIVLGIVLLLRRHEAVPTLTARTAIWFLACGSIGIALYNWLLNSGLKTVSPAAASFLVACQPVFAALVAWIVFKEAFGLRAWIGTMICLAGAGVVAVERNAAPSLDTGELLVLLAAVCSGTYFAIQRPLVAAHGALASAFYAIVTGALFLSPWLLNGVSQFASATTNAKLALAYLAVLPGALAYVTWMVAIDGLGAARAANVLFLMAPLASLLSVPVTGTWPSLATCLGGTIALAGVAIVHTRSRPSR
jgi:drug/metabolite transporter (DMT)-like permease